MPLGEEGGSQVKPSSVGSLAVRLRSEGSPGAAGVWGGGDNKIIIIIISSGLEAGLGKN